VPAFSLARGSERWQTTAVSHDPADARTGRSTPENVIVLGERFERAVAHARVVHAGQVRKGTTVPYLSHLLAVAALVLEHGGDEEQAIGALLHDALEDGKGRTSADDIGRRFGPRVRDVVEACTDGEPDAQTGRKEPWRIRKERFIRRLGDASADTLLVSACDKLHNARAFLDEYRRVGPALWERFQGRRDGTRWYYAAVVAALDAAIGREHAPGLARAAGELRRCVQDLEREIAAREGPSAS
jgi:hypothetical protein